MVKPVKWPGNFSGLRPRRRLGLEILVACEGRASLSHGGVSCRVRRHLAAHRVPGRAYAFAPRHVPEGPWETKLPA